MKKNISSLILVIIGVLSTFSFVYSAVITPVFPTSLNNFQEGDTIEDEDWNAIELTIGETSTTSKATLHGKWNDLFASTTLPQITTLVNLSTLGTITSGIWNGTVIGDSYITKTGNWTGTFDGQEGSYYLNANNLTNFGSPFYSFFNATDTDSLSEGSVNFYWTDTRFDNRLSASTSIPTLTTLANLTTTGALSSGSITSGFGSIDIGNDTLNAGSATFDDITLNNVGNDMLLSTDSSGNIVATSSPQVAFITATSTTATSTFAGGLNVAGTSGLTVLQNGNVGIGTASPGAPLDIFNSGGNGARKIQFSGGAYTTTIDDGLGGAIVIGSSQTANAKFRLLPYDNNIYFQNTYSAGSIYFTGLNSTNLSGNVIFKTTGNVGIGTVSPSHKLDVNGFVNTSGTVGGYKIDGNTILQASSTNYSTLVGDGAGAGLLADGLYNTALGYQALKDNTTADRVTAIGYRALYKNTTGLRNTAVGMSAAQNNTTGYENTAIGAQALSSNTVGYKNTAFGSYALNTNTTGSTNVAIGSTALYRNTTGGNNFGLGFQSLYNNVDGSSNIGIGTNTLYNTTGSGNIAIGINAGDNITTGSNNLILGYDIDAPSATLSNQLSIGNLIFGTGIDGTGTTLSSGNVGIGTTSPYAKLSVVGETVSEYFTATSTTATSTLPNLSVSNFLAYSGTATSTWTNGLNLTDGCFAINGVCVGGGGAGVSGGTAGMLTSWVDGTTLTATGTPTASHYIATSTATSTFAGSIMMTKPNGGFIISDGLGTGSFGTTYSGYPALMGSAYTTDTGEATLGGYSSTYKIQMPNDGELLSISAFEGEGNITWSKILELGDPSTTGANYIRIQNSATSNAPKISAQGSDTNVNLDLSAKGSSGSIINTSTSGYFRTNLVSGYTDQTNIIDLTTSPGITLYSGGSKVFEFDNTISTTANEIKITNGSNSATTYDTSSILNNYTNQNMVLGGSGTLALKTYNGGWLTRLYFENDGDAGFGTTTPVGDLHVTGGTGATTTVSFSEIGDTTSKTCFNINQSDGSAGSFYFAGGVMVIENNYCK